MTPRKTHDYRCPCCDHEWLIRVYMDDGSHTADSEPLVEDEHGNYAICPACKRMIRMEHPGDIWIPARQQDCA